MATNVTIDFGRDDARALKRGRLPLGVIRVERVGIWVLNCAEHAAPHALPY